jgi:hypothetical protein
MAKASLFERFAAMPDADPIPNPLADALSKQYAEQLQAVLQYVACSTEGPTGLGGQDRERTARDAECKQVWIKLGAGFRIDITGNIAQQVINGLEKQAHHLEEDAQQLRAAVAAGKFPPSPNPDA